jgi:hypothetical protein
LPPLPSIGTKNVIYSDTIYESKEQEMKESERKLYFYRKEINKMRDILDGSYNLKMIIGLEDDQANKIRMLKGLEE